MKKIIFNLLQSSSVAGSPLMSMFKSLTTLVTQFTSQAASAVKPAAARTAETATTSTTANPVLQATSSPFASWSSGFDSYTGFGLNGWQSGIQRIGQLAMNEAVNWETSGANNDLELYDYLPRAFSNNNVVNSAEDILIQTLRQLNTAVHIEKKS